MKSGIAAVIALAVAGCEVTPQATTTCNAQNWQELVGQPEAAVHAALGNLRIVRAGAPVTKDFNPDRLNAEIDENGRVTRFACY